MGEGEAEEDSARRGVEERRLLAEEVRQRDEAVAARRRAGGLGVEPRVGDLAHPEIARALRGEPFHERAARRHAAIQQEEAGHVVVVDVEPRVGREPVDGEEDVARPADLEDELARRRPGGERRGHVVGAARDDRRARGGPSRAPPGASRRPPPRGARARGRARPRRSPPRRAPGRYHSCRRASQRPDSSAQFCSRLHSPASRHVM